MAFWDRFKKLVNHQFEQPDSSDEEAVNPRYQQKKNHFPESENRQIRVFISSTFRDMQEERDILIKIIFPQLRKICEERSVTWTEVDLRWGITTEQAAEGKVLPLCLEEIHRCRPYFIGLLGERYGWVPYSYPTELLELQPWLNQHLRHSVTELEILHGVLNMDQMHQRAYFYFRDPAYVESIPESERQNFKAESDESAEKVHKLKEKIRNACDNHICELREYYSNPRQLGEWILEDFTELINILYPLKNVPDSLDQEAFSHEIYAQNRRFAFIGRDDLLNGLDTYASNGGKPFILTGESGCGKSALLAEWVTRWRMNHPDDLIIQHYVGSTPNSADWQRLVRRILGEFKRTFAITDEIPSHPEALRAGLTNWITKVPDTSRIILVLDALNQLTNEDAAYQLSWLPVSFPSNFRIITSSLTGESLETLRKRNWPEMYVPLFSPADIAPAASAYFKFFSKTLPPEIIKRMESTPAACNALYLRAVLDELRQFGNHEKLGEKASDYLSAPDLPELFGRILKRWDDDFGKDPICPDLVRRSLCLISCARYGLSESELLNLLGKNGMPMARRPWTPFYLAVENSLVLRSGLLNFGHSYLSDAVRKRWLSDNQSCSVHRDLAEYFDRIVEPTNRKLDELPWQLYTVADNKRLLTCLTDLKMFEAMATERNQWELVRYWAWLEKFSDPESAYSEALKIWEKKVTSEDHFAVLLGNVGIFYTMIGRPASAVNVLRRAVQILEHELGPNHDDTIVMRNNLAQSLAQTGEFDEALLLLRSVLDVRKRKYGEYHASTVKTRNNLADTLRLRGQSTNLRSLFDDVQKDFKENGTISRDDGSAILKLSSLLKNGPDEDGAESMFREALTISERELGTDHPSTLLIVNNLGLVLAQKCSFEAAESYYLRALEGRERILGKDHPDTLVTVLNLARLMIRLGDYDKALPLCRRALIGFEAQLGPDHANSRKSREMLDEIL